MSVVKRIHADTKNSEKAKERFHWNDVAILVRSNSDADPFVRALEAAGIPYDIASSRGLYRTPIVLDTISYLDLLDNYHESASLYRVLRMSIWGISDEAVFTCLREARKKNHSLYEVITRAGTIGVKPGDQQKIHTLLQMIDTHAAIAKHHGPAKVMAAFYKDSGLVNRWRSAEATPVELQELSFAEQLYRVAEGYERANETPTVKGFKEFIRLSIEAGDQGAIKRDDEGPEAVKVMTMHAAKGLEFKMVFVVSMVDRRFPTQYRPEPLELPLELMKEILPQGDWHLQEERRLMYVAITRAKEQLYFTSAEDYGGVRKKKSSLFLYELGLIEQESVNKKQEIRKQKETSFVGGSPAIVAATTYSLPPTHLPAYFSFTQLKAYESCPLQYKFAHILKIPIEGRYTFSFGKSMHKALELFFARMIRSSKQTQLFEPEPAVKEVTLEDLLSLYDQSWLNEWYESKDHERKYYNDGKKFLKEFYEIHAKKWPTPRYLEKPFTLKFGDIELRGVIDRVDTLVDGVKPEIEIIDYKTGRVPEGNTIPFDKKQQLLLYQLAIQRLSDEQPKMLSYYYIEQNKKVSFLGTPEDLEKVETFVVETAQKIRSGDFSPTPDPMICKFCDFNTICEFRAI